MINLPNLIKWESDFLKNLLHQGKSDNSLKSYRLDFECLHQYLETIPHEQIKDFNAEVLNDFNNFLEKKYPKINSRRRKLQTLRLFFDFLIEKNLFPSNPIKNIASAPKKLLPPSPVKYPIIFQMNELLKQSFKEETSRVQKYVLVRNQCLLRLIYHAGLSVSLISQIKVSDLLFNNDSLRVLISPPKKDPYSIPLPDAPFFQFYIEQLSEYKLDELSNHLIFHANAHKIIKGGLSPRGIEEIFKKLSEKIKSPVTPRKIRQSCIIRWIIEGQSPVNIKDWMGVAPSYSLSAFHKYIKEQKSQEQEKDYLDYKILNYEL